MEDSGRSVINRILIGARAATFAGIAHPICDHRLLPTAKTIAVATSGTGFSTLRMPALNLCSGSIVFVLEFGLLFPLRADPEDRQDPQDTLRDLPDVGISRHQRGSDLQCDSRSDVTNDLVHAVEQFGSRTLADLVLRQAGVFQMQIEAQLGEMPLAIRR